MLGMSSHASCKPGPRTRSWSAKPQHGTRPFHCRHQRHVIHRLWSMALCLVRKCTRCCKPHRQSNCTFPKNTPRCRSSSHGRQDSIVRLSPCKHLGLGTHKNHWKSRKEPYPLHTPRESVCGQRLKYLSRICLNSMDSGRKSSTEPNRVLTGAGFSFTVRSQS